MPGLEPFIVRALLAGIALSIVAAPLGCLVVWRRMSYFGATIAHAGLLGVALGLFLNLELTVGILAVAVALALLLVVLERQQLLPVDSLLGLLSHATLALGLIAASLLAGQRLDLMSYLFGDIFAVTWTDLGWMVAGSMLVLGVIGWLWLKLIAVTVNDEIAAAEGVEVDRVHTIFVLILAVFIALAMKVIGILLVVAFLIMPAMAARPFAGTPEQMVVMAAAAGVFGTVGGILASWWLDIPGGPAIVVVLSILAGLGLTKSITARA